MPAGICDATRGRHSVLLVQGMAQGNLTENSSSCALPFVITPSSIRICISSFSSSSSSSDPRTHLIIAHQAVRIERLARLLQLTLGQRRESSAIEISKSTAHAEGERRRRSSSREFDQPAPIQYVLLTEGRCSRVLRSLTSLSALSDTPARPSTNTTCLQVLHVVLQLSACRLELLGLLLKGEGSVRVYGGEWL